MAGAETFAASLRRQAARLGADVVACEVVGDEVKVVFSSPGRPVLRYRIRPDFDGHWAVTSGPGGSGSTVNALELVWRAVRHYRKKRAAALTSTD